MAILSSFSTLTNCPNYGVHYIFDGRRFRALTVVDNYSRECLEIEVGQSIKGEDVVRVMERIKLIRGVVPRRIKVDNGSELQCASSTFAFRFTALLELLMDGSSTNLG